MDRVFKAAFILSLCMASFAYGAGMVYFEVPPYHFLRGQARELVVLYQHKESYLGIEPARWLKKAHHQGNGVTVNVQEQVQPGITFMTGFFGEAVATQLVDGDGEVIHRWIDTTSWNTPEIHGAVPLPDGSVVIVRSGNGLRRLEKCGNEMWKLGYRAHHSVFLSEDGTLWVSGRRRLKRGDPRLADLYGITAPFVEDTVIQVSLEGEILQEFSVPKLLLDADMEGLLFASGEDVPGSKFLDDLTHLNDVEVLQTTDADAFPMLRAGDVMVSLRNVNLVFVFDPETREIKWHQTGPWLRQHDPDFRPDGKITIFNNRRDGTQLGTRFGGSNILELDPASRRVKVLYQGTEDRVFYTDTLGKHQNLENGNLLISSGEEGRVFEVNPAGEIVWEFINRYDEDRVIMLHEGTRFPKDYFEVDRWTCP